MDAISGIFASTVMAWNLEVAEAYASFRSLKPDGVGLLTDLPASRRISWGDVQVVIKVKSDIKALVIGQAGCQVLSRSLS